jgi:predicted RNA polymerase sigma factor
VSKIIGNLRLFIAFRVSSQKGCLFLQVYSLLAQKYHLLAATQGHVLAALGRLDEARAAFSAALECDCTLPEKRFLQHQLEMVLMQRHS